MNQQSKRNVFLFPSHKNWILHAIARESAVALNLGLREIWVPRGKREALNLKNLLIWQNLKTIPNLSLFIHQDVLDVVSNKKLSIQGSRVYFTHNNKNTTVIPDLIEVLSKTSKVLTQNKSSVAFLESQGLPKGLALPVYGGVDRRHFFPKDRENSELETNYRKDIREILSKEFVLIVGDCKSRKNPEFVIEVIRSNPKINFVIHGRGWKRMLENRTIQNLTFFEFEFSVHPILIREARALLSLSKLEGGPYPTIEAMASGTPVLVTDTGWNSELVTREAGFVLPTEVNGGEVSGYLQKVIEMKEEVQHRDLLYGKLSWTEVGEKLYL